MSDKKGGFFHRMEHKIELSAIITVVGIILLFSTAIIVTLIAPRFIDSTWTEPTTPYQVQMYEVSDPNLYISSSTSSERQQVYHIQRDLSLLAFQENNQLRILASKDLEKYVTRLDEKQLKLSSSLLLLRIPKAGSEQHKQADEIRKTLQTEWEAANPDAEKEGLARPVYEILELYAPEGNSAFALAPSESILENWVDKDFVILDDNAKHPHHEDPGVIYIQNPHEYRTSPYVFNNVKGWQYDPKGQPIKSIEELKNHELGFLSRQELIRTGEHIYAIEGCSYCHSDQTRTLIQDTVLNGSDSFPAPPSSANEYIYQYITFLSTRRIGPDLSRVGVKRPSRDWHMAHFWSPKTASAGSIMPTFRHFFDNDPRGSARQQGIGVPNYQFEAIFQYLMTKGTRITPPTQAWWLGKDPIRTKEVIEGQRTLK